MEASPRSARCSGLHPVLPCRWDLAPAEAIQTQEELRHRVRPERVAVGRLARVAGCDLAIAGDRLCASVRVFALPHLELLDAADAVRPTAFPYVPGLLSFREAPALLAAFARLRIRPDAILCDGQGVAHPRRFGLACHLGVLLDLPSVGCAKSRLVGTHREPATARGSTAPLLDGDEVMGAVVRTRSGVRPIYVSIGHRIRLDDAVRLVLRCGGGYRLPEPTRQADLAAGRLARALEASGS